MLHRGPSRSLARASAPSRDPELELFGLGDLFLAGLSEGARATVLADAVTYEVEAGTPLLTGAQARVGLVETGLAREYLTAGDGRQLTIRYIHAGVLIANLTGVAGGRSPSRTEAVVQSRILEFNSAAVFRLIRTDPAVAVAMFAETSRWLEAAYVALAATGFGSMRERVARHLLDRAGPDPASGCLVAPGTQLQLAEAIGTVREVVARILRDLRREGLVKTSVGGVEILDPAGLAALVGRWQGASRRPASVEASDAATAAAGF